MKEFYDKNILGDTIYSLSKEEEYFNKRMEAIKNYSADFFKKSALAKLADRYIALYYRSPEGSEIKDFAKDCLVSMGIDDYCLENEVVTVDEFGSNLTDQELFLGGFVKR